MDSLPHAPHPPLERSDDGRLTIDARTPLPTEFGTFDVRLFHFDGTTDEHIALVRGDLEGDRPWLVRVHSECFTSEVLSSMRCDCRGQLDFAMERIAREGRGIVVYLRQEGRGIGLANKLRAYALQACGDDTVDANRHLHLPDDVRTYDAAASLLKHLGITRIRLMTNNPLKVEALAALGIEIVERIPVLVETNPLARRYLETKRDRMGHLLPDDLRDRAQG